MSFYQPVSRRRPSRLAEGVRERREVRFQREHAIHQAQVSEAIAQRARGPLDPSPGAGSWFAISARRVS